MHQGDSTYQLDETHTVRQARPDDITRIAEIWKQGVAVAFGPSQKALPSDEAISAQFEKLVAQQDKNFKFWVCLQPGGEIVGWSTVQPFDPTPLDTVRAGFGFISTYFSATHRGLGVAKKLVAFMMDFCWRHTEIAYVLGLQDRSNVPSVRMTDAVGFKNLGDYGLNKGIDPFSVISRHAQRTCRSSHPLPPSSPLYSGWPVSN